MSVAGGRGGGGEGGGKKVKSVIKVNFIGDGLLILKEKYCLPLHL